jgi:hypothetical protein
MKPLYSHAICEYKSLDPSSKSLGNASSHKTFARRMVTLELVRPFVMIIRRDDLQGRWTTQEGSILDLSFT